MAKTSKKMRNDNITVKQPLKIYSVGIYTRLSVDKDDRKNESIETQLEIAKNYLKDHPNMVLHDCYSDLGKSGTNFKREGFERMMQDVRMRKIDCIIVKDLSRFGRNHIETGNYLEKIFPFLGVRFIAVTDNFDSTSMSNGNETMIINLKNLVNEMYAKDIAIKTVASKRALWEQGVFIGGVSPYGYRADQINGKRCLVIEETTSDIVKKIYEMFLLGKNMKEIARWLYDNNVHRPGDYQQTGHIFAQEGEILQEWLNGTIKRLLTNPAYMGCMIQARTCGKDYKLRERHDVDSEDWSVKEHTHEAIISEATFYQCALKFEEHSAYCNKKGFSKTVPLDEDIFCEVIYCGECGRRMCRFSSTKDVGNGNKVRNYGYYCQYSKKIDELSCDRKYISLIALTKMVKTALSQEFALSAMRPKKLVEQNKLEAAKRKKDWNSELLTIQNKMENIKKRSSEDYLKYRMGELEKDAFLEMKKENDLQISELHGRQVELIGMLRQIDVETEKKNHFLRGLLKFNQKTILTKEVIDILINRIEVYPDKRVKIIFNFTRKEVL